MNLTERLSLDVTAWKPAPGDQLVGEVVEVTEAVSEYGAYPRLVVLDEQGKGWAFNAFHTVAKSELAKARPRSGDRIGIKYLGRTDGKSYDGYRIVIEHATPEPDSEPNWESHARSAAEDMTWESRLSDASVDDAPPLNDYDGD